MTKWLELAHEKQGYINPTALYWMGGEHACNEVGFSNSEIGCWYTSHEFSYLGTPGAFIGPAQAILQQLKQEKLLDKIIKINKTQIPVMLKAAQKLSGDLSTVSGEELYKRWQDWLEKFLYLMRWSAMGTVMEMEKPLLTNELESLLVQKLGKGNPEIGEYFQILTSSTERTIAGQEEIDLLALRLKQLAGTLDDKEIDKHTKKYSWIAFGYAGPGWSINDIKERLGQLPEEKVEIKKIIKEKEKAGPVLQKQQQELENKLKLNKQERYLFHILRTLGFWKFERKFRNQQAHEMMEDFVKEIGKRNNLSVPQVKMIAPKEMEQVLLQGKVDADALNQRIKECVVIFRGLDHEVLWGDKVKKLSEEIQKSLTVDVNIKELKGSTAYSGQATGAVKRVDGPEDMSKLEEGDILVSMSTNPQILSAMKRAGAVVTDTGGITCHAAIVAREIKIPTLIGTKIATKIFKDGDKVEVDCTKGIIRKL